MFTDSSILANETGLDYQTLDSSLPFSEYILQCRSLIMERRLYSEEKSLNQAIEANTPFELYPTNPVLSNNKIKYGALLIHGLWDCPFSLKDIAYRLQEKGILSRALLLPGHGTRPSDLHKISYEDWLQNVDYGIQSLQQDVDKIFLIGYSAGAALSLYQALNHRSISGLLLLAPAIAVKFSMDIVFNYHAFIKNILKNKKWIFLEDEIDYAKYRSISFNSGLQMYKLTHALTKLQNERKLNCPVFMAMSQNDETISSPTAMNFFSTLSHQNDQLLLYTDQKNLSHDSRIVYRNSSFPQLGIANLSHVSLPFSENNIHYGRNGDYIHASKPDDQVIYGAYNRVWEKIYKPIYQFGLINKCRRELTYNPDFDFLAEQITQFILGN